MNDREQLLLQAWVDGEVSAAEARRAEELAHRDPEARALVAELRMTAAALATGEPARVLPESREFFWCKIEREIQRPVSRLPARKAIPVARWFVRWLAPAGVVVLLTFLLLSPELGTGWWTKSLQGAEIENPQEDVSSYTFRSDSDRMTVVWINTH